MHQQCWCWGCDIRRPEGNLLLAYGFQRRRPPEGVHGGSAYTYELDSMASIRLWGFGLFFRIRGLSALYVNRYEFLPRLAPSDQLPDSVFLPEQVPATLIPKNLTETEVAEGMLSRVMRWVAAYEAWVLDICGLAYRDSCLRGWDQPCIDPLEAPERWRSLAAALTSGAHGRGETART